MLSSRSEKVGIGARLNDARSEGPRRYAQKRHWFPPNCSKRANTRVRGTRRTQPVKRRDSRRRPNDAPGRIAPRWLRSAETSRCIRSPTPSVARLPCKREQLRGRCRQYRLTADPVPFNARCEASSSIDSALSRSTIASSTLSRPLLGKVVRIAAIFVGSAFDRYSAPPLQQQIVRVVLKAVPTSDLDETAVPYAETFENEFKYSVFVGLRIDLEPVAGRVPGISSLTRA